MVGCDGLNIVLASSQEIEAIKDLWNEYWVSLALPADFQSFPAQNVEIERIHREQSVLFLHERNEAIIARLALSVAHDVHVLHRAVMTGQLA